jgi:cytochrome c oxidase subunit 2
MRLPVLRSRALVTLLALFAGTADADETVRGRELYAPCAACHGAAGEGNRATQAPKLAGLPEWYVARQLHNFRNERRGTDEADAYGTQMARMAEQLWDEREVASVAAYVASLAPVATEPTLRAGKPARGKPVYAGCAACHGSDAAGNAELGAPPLRGREDWYLVAELAAFRAGTRGAHTEDLPGQTMRAAAGTLPGEQAVLDVAAYLAALRADEVVTLHRR